MRLPLLNYRVCTRTHLRVTRSGPRSSRGAGVPAWGRCSAERTQPRTGLALLGSPRWTWRERSLGGHNHTVKHVLARHWRQCFAATARPNSGGEKRNSEVTETLPVCEHFNGSHQSTRQQCYHPGLTRGAERGIGQFS